MTENLNNKIEKNKNVIQIASLIVSLFIVISSVIYSTTSMKTTVENDVKRNKQEIERVEAKLDKRYDEIQQEKVNKAVFEMLISQINRIEQKLDNLQRDYKNNNEGK